MKRLLYVLGAATLLLVPAGVLVTSAFPDGLKRVAQSLGFASRGKAAPPGSLFADYQARFFHSRWAAQASAGLVGVVLLYGFGMLLAHALRRRASSKELPRP